MIGLELNNCVSSLIKEDCFRSSDNCFLDYWLLQIIKHLNGPLCRIQVSASVKAYDGRKRTIRAYDGRQVPVSTSKYYIHNPLLFCPK